MENEADVQGGGIYKNSKNIEQSLFWGAQIKTPTLSK